MKIFVSVTILATSCLVGAIPHRGGRFSTGGRNSTEGGNSTTSIESLDALLPTFGVIAGTNKDKNDNCQGINLAGKITAIQCHCPPDRALFLNKLSKALAAGEVAVPDEKGVIHRFPITFSTKASGNDTAANRDRATAALTVLQNFDGLFGKGCPAVSVPNFQSMQGNGISVNRQLVPPR